MFVLFSELLVCLVVIFFNVLYKHIVKYLSVLSIFVVFFYLLPTVQEHNSDFEIRVIFPSVSSDVDIVTSEEVKRICMLSAVRELSDSATVGVVQLINVCLCVTETPCMMLN